MHSYNFQTGNHLKISLVDFVHSVKQIKVAWLLELIKLCSIMYVEGLSRRVLLLPSAATASEGYTATCQEGFQTNIYVCPQCGHKKLNKLDDNKILKRGIEKISHSYLKIKST